MSRRNDEIDFGSDSFLDVLANIVGILIILIVIAGLRVSHAPVRLSSADETEGTAPIEVPLLSITPPEAEPEPIGPTIVYTAKPPAAKPIEGVGVDQFANYEQRDLRIEPLAPEGPPPKGPELILPQALMDQAAKLSEQLGSLSGERDRLANSRAKLDARITSTRKALDEATGSALATESETAVTRRQLAALETEMEETRRLLGVLERNVAEAQQAPVTTELEHQMTPLSRVVSGAELHFRLEGGRVTAVPVSELAERLSLSIQRQKEVLLKMTEYEGTVGPVDGYIMDYRIERAKSSLAEELQYGRNMVRMNVSKWTLLPEPGLRGETAEEAVQRDSNFYRVLMGAGPVTTLTFWVYPDSFDLHRDLQDFARRNGYQVAARPLPPGVPITGSPQGSRSVAQ